MFEILLFVGIWSLASLCLFKECLGK